MPSRVDLTDDEFEHILHTWEPPAPDEHSFVFHNSDDIDTWISTNIGA